MSKEKQKSLIEVVIKRSIEIILAQAANQSLKETRFFVNRLSEPFDKMNCITMMNIELNEKINDNKLRISKLLEPIFKAAGLSIPQKYWLSSRNLEDGYVLIYKDTLQVIPTHVLLLNGLKKYLGDRVKRYQAGEIVPFVEISGMLSSIEGVVTSTSPIKITYSIKKLRRNEKV